MRKRDLSIFGSAFLDGFSMAGLFTQLRRPGAPTQVFAESEHPASDVKDKLQIPDILTSQSARSAIVLWVFMDVLAAAGALFVASILVLQAGPLGFLQERNLGSALGLSAGSIFALVLVSWRLRLYEPTELPGHWHEQRLSLLACTISGLLLMSALYMLGADEIAFEIALTSLALLTSTLIVRRLIYRILLYRLIQEIIDRQSLVVLGAGPEGLDKARKILVMEGFEVLQNKSGAVH